MSLAATRLSLTHRATTQRPSSGTDTWGTPDVPEWNDRLTDLPCRLWTSAGREVIANTSTIVVVEDLRMIVTVDTDVTEQDRISAVTDRGAELVAGASIRAVLRLSDHLELVLMRAA